MGARTIVSRRPGVKHVVPAKAKVIERFDPNEDFSDVNGSDISQFHLENERPDRVYAWPTDSSEDKQRFQSGQLGLRYKVEYYEGDDVEGALRPAGGFGLLQKGDIIRVGNHVCMSVDRALWEKRRRFEASQTREGKRAIERARRGDVVAGKHDGMWAGLEGFRSGSTGPEDAAAGRQ